MAKDRKVLQLTSPTTVIPRPPPSQGPGDDGFYKRGRQNFPDGHSVPCLFIMPERIARTDPFRKITEHIGSGPMRFVERAFVTGSIAIFERFAGYQPGAEQANWMAGGKRMNFDCIK